MTHGRNNKGGFRSFTEEDHKEASSKGGRAKVPKGLAYIKRNDPKKFQEIQQKSREARRRKAALLRNAAEQS